MGSELIELSAGPCETFCRNFLLDLQVRESRQLEVVLKFKTCSSFRVSPNAAGCGGGGHAP